MSEFIQNGWDQKRFQKGLTPKVKSVYIEGEVEVNVLEDGPIPEAGHWFKQGSYLNELIDSMDHLKMSDEL